MPSPLEHLKVLDFSPLLPGPYATQIMADMGADVLRVESPTRIDAMRTVEPIIDGISAVHGAINRNKRSLALDLKKPQAKDIVFKLLADYDIVVEQFRPGVMERLGFGYDSLSAINPSLIYCSLTGYGQEGPLRNRAGHDINYLSLSGLASYSGRKEFGPVLSGTQIADIAGGSHQAVMGILAAVIQRQNSGVGQHIDISMSDASLALTLMHSASYLNGGQVPGMESELVNGGSFYDYYKTADNRYISVGSLEPQFCSAFFAVIGRPDWAVRAAEKSRNVQILLKKDIQDVISKKSLADWEKLFANIDACVEPVLNLEEVKNHPHFQERGMFVEVPTESGGRLLQLGSPIKFSKAEHRYDFAGVALGAHNEEVLGEIGFSHSEINELRANEVIS